MLLVIVWDYYTETALAPQYNITQDGFIYYYLFSLISIPFQVLIDILFYNIIDLYHDINFYKYLIDCKDRFNKRKTKWVGDSNESTEEVENKSASIHVLCFSSQYFFAMTMAMSGIFLLFFGFQILLSTQGYNIFADELNAALVFIWLLVCYLLEKISCYIARLCKLWELPNSQSQDEDKSLILKMFTVYNFK